ncbi:hypothetical protein M378DRAFT_169315 [Amanita muscaria Koide BX008]|uniref:Uncharacterized protein n=1 Tax=Amanita muscaria (strain Koide BX008) TaxID=946122 RepID=A0A0C2SZ03_AMAMK|nr:hypothetical protein M378DRAFT_169315 [Amanita muscaria Koide BX008]
MGVLNAAPHLAGHRCGPAFVLVKDAFGLGQRSNLNKYGINKSKESPAPKIARHRRSLDCLTHLLCYLSP